MARGTTKKWRELIANRARRRNVERGRADCAHAAVCRKNAAFAVAGYRDSFAPQADRAGNAERMIVSVRIVDKCSRSAYSVGNARVGWLWAGNDACGNSERRLD
jgi:hypothetical protein